MLHPKYLLFIILLSFSSSFPSFLNAACENDTWTAVSNTDAPSARYLHTAVWTGTEMIIWGGVNSFCCGVLDTGGRYDSATDDWDALSTVNAPSGRYHHTAVWTGSKMIIWGGFDQSIGDETNTGGIYDPATDTWTPTSTIDAPAARQVHTAIWTGTEMIIWGGADTQGNFLETGAKYNPATDTWTDITTADAPAARSNHTAVWAGRDMIVWGGISPAGFENTGGRYNPEKNAWVSMSLQNAPDGRFNHTAVWTGKQMIVWGGIFLDEDDPFFNTGGRYIPRRDVWRATSTTNAPTQRAEHTAVWTGKEMLIWGGQNFLIIDDVEDELVGGRYNPVRNTWTAMNTTNSPSKRGDHTAVWTGQEMIIWGGLGNNTGVVSTGGRYCAN